MTRVYYNEQHPNGEKFTSTSFLTFVNRIFTVVFALALIGGARSVEQLQPRTRDVGQYAARVRQGVRWWLLEHHLLSGQTRPSTSSPFQCWC